MLAVSLSAPPELLIAALKRFDGAGFLSGSAIAAELGCSRATVHNLLDRAGAYGVRVQAVRGRGYRLVDALSWLDEEALRRDAQALGFEFRYRPSVSSTNAVLLAEASSSAAAPVLLATDWQSAGRGRRGRAWLGGLGSSLAFSILWRFNRPVAELSGLSLAVGVMLADALRDLGLNDVRVKWPNDLLLPAAGGHAKLAGVLIELAGDMLGPATAVIGIGLNVGAAAWLRGNLDQPAAALHERAPGLARGAVLQALSRSLAAGLKQFDQLGFPVFAPRWEALHAFQGAEVAMLDAQGGRVSGQALGVDARGGLRLRTGQGDMTFVSGEVSLRGVDG